MPSPSALAAFAAASLLLALAPGPDNLFVLALAASRGARAGLMTTLGLCAGLVVHTTAVALGVAAFLAASPAAFAGLKIAGAAYLAYLAFRAFRAEPTGLSAATAEKPGAYFWRGVVMNVSNPKVALFFLAFLPQFVAPAEGSMAGQIFLLGLIFQLCAFIVFALISFGAGKIGLWLRRSPRAQIVLNRLAGALFLVLAARLATS
ncbi:LysE family translocator [Rhodoblastus sp. 17X3]|uniref:LysE family translocator n=1 Tax=Rhodoblastus sp. 17X3 TaxID=3047026 RepID=UPI0024B7E7E3|nr:LysE family translocator [Rhodoblastus sp. 17X3]MDI9848024.1 LysE family translocator [Rhodoblastus sp. 17X3]